MDLGGAKERSSRFRDVMKTACEHRQEDLLSKCLMKAFYSIFFTLLSVKVILREGILVSWGDVFHLQLSRLIYMPNLKDEVLKILD